MIKAEASDREIVNAVLKGERNAFARLMKQNERLVLHIVQQLIPASEDRRDLYQDIFLKVYKNLSGFAFESKLSTWIAKIAYTSCHKKIAKKRPLLWEELKVSGKADDEENTVQSIGDFTFNKEEEPDELLMSKELTNILQQEIAALPSLPRTLLTLFYQEEMSLAEIEVVTNLPINTIKSHLFRTRKYLKELLIEKYKF
ncbi:RNA polymerase sigma factor [Emticicia sp. BO119]|uniref:RNA polymerase sigma factor n=1 Tax=Emticicia sp. BO119 TaxID=2757768 RepID=UPI0015F09296|nr:sigma-70 family RNA polymerase sigma factor [Emticicia sp. BO119]MBA4853039.1 sigma-70 family RNA polymerase sigma factor [Emticicia sp. BO119]